MTCYLKKRYGESKTIRKLNGLREGTYEDIIDGQTVPAYPRGREMRISDKYSLSISETREFYLKERSIKTKNGVIKKGKIIIYDNFFYYTDEMKRKILKEKFKKLEANSHYF